MITHGTSEEKENPGTTIEEIPKILGQWDPQNGTFLATIARQLNVSLRTAETLLYAEIMFLQAKLSRKGRAGAPRKYPDTVARFHESYMRRKDKGGLQQAKLPVPKQQHRAPRQPKRRWQSVQSWELQQPGLPPPAEPTKTAKTAAPVVAQKVEPLPPVVVKKNANLLLSVGEEIFYCTCKGNVFHCSTDDEKIYECTACGKRYTVNQ